MHIYKHRPTHNKHRSTDVQSRIIHTETYIHVTHTHTDRQTNTHVPESAKRLLMVKMGWTDGGYHGRLRVTTQTVLQQPGEKTQIYIPSTNLTPRPRFSYYKRYKPWEGGYPLNMNLLRAAEANLMALTTKEWSLCTGCRPSSSCL